MDENSNSAKPSKPRRRRFQFRLRTLLIGLALLSIPCGYAAHEAAIVRARKNWLATHDKRLMDEPPPGWHHLLYRPSVLRRLLGDSEYTGVEANSEADADEAKRLFPEATVSWPLAPIWMRDKTEPDLDDAQSAPIDPDASQPQNWSKE